MCSAFSTCVLFWCVAHWAVHVITCTTVGFSVMCGNTTLQSCNRIWIKSSSTTMFAWIFRLNCRGMRRPLLQGKLSNCSIVHKDFWHTDTHLIHKHIKTPTPIHTIVVILRGGRSNSNRYYYKMAKSTYHSHEGRSARLCRERLDCCLSLSLSL